MATGRLAVLSNVNMNMVIRMLQKQAEVYDAEGYGNELGALLNVEPERFYPFPTKYEIHEYGIMESFVEELPSGKARDELAGAIRGRGAFRRFKNGIRWH